MTGTGAQRRAPTAQEAGVLCRTPRKKCSCGKRLSVCSTCTQEGIALAGTDLCMLHAFLENGKMVYQRKARCVGCTRSPPAKQRIKLQTGLTMLVSDYTWALHNLGSKGFEFKKKKTSITQRYHDIAGRVLQAVTKTPELIPRDSGRPEPGWTMGVSSNIKGTCKKCRPANGVPVYRPTLPEPPTTKGSVSNWVLGHFEFAVYLDVYIGREQLPGRQGENCPCAFKYFDAELRHLLRSWHPRHGEKERCLKYLAHYAWTDSREQPVSEFAGWLRAHVIADCRRFAKMQAWEVSHSMSGCTLRRNAASRVEKLV